MTKNSSTPLRQIGLLQMVVRQEAASENPTILRVTWLPSKHNADFFPSEMSNIILLHYSSCVFPLSCPFHHLFWSHQLNVQNAFHASCFQLKEITISLITICSSTLVVHQPSSTWICGNLMSTPLFQNIFVVGYAPHP